MKVTLDPQFPDTHPFKLASRVKALKIRRTKNKRAKLARKRNR